jgi:D-glycero-alpha-D-manno-heptose-7-phosphate kinase
VIIARAPLRISIGGGGTDLPSYYSQYGGFILGAAIDKYVYLYVNRPAADDLVRVKYSRYEEVTSAEDVQHDLVRPVLKLLDIDSNIEITSMADVPAGTGLGSSSTYIVALLVALHELRRRPLPPQALAELAGHVEIDLAGHPVGKQDHYMAAFGGLTCLDIEPDGTTHVTPLNISISAVEQLEAQILLFFTGLSRSANSILAAQRKDTEEGDANVVESLHTTKQLGLRIKTALEENRLDDFGRMMHEHWENKKRRSGSISDPRIDQWYEAARAAGALGGKIVGAGGGGFLMLYCPQGAKGAVRAALSSSGLREMPFRFDFEGAKTMVNL